MMRPADFFIYKAKEYTNSIDELLADPGLSVADAERSARISDLRFKVKQLFAEFGDAGIFSMNVASIDENKMLYGEEEEALERYKYTLFLFANHAARAGEQVSV